MREKNENSNIKREYTKSSLEWRYRKRIEKMQENFQLRMKMDEFHINPKKRSKLKLFSYSKTQ
jgi:hypothetical protein